MIAKIRGLTKFPIKIKRYTPLISLSILVVSLISMPAFAQQMSFNANLSGGTLSPLVNTVATGTAKFNLDSSGNMAYNIDVTNLKGVIGAHISLQNGTDLAQVFNPYVQVNGRSEIPTGQVNGQLSKGIITESDLSGPLSGKNVTDLATLMKNNSAYVVVRTMAHEKGEIQGVITPSNTSQNRAI
ncbi:MAG: CHRD domain-containing protein [Nitrososphaeraceae archaeon]|nr:CHRD domain-containing protein [Nitrososphaeraceae archaeon]